MKGFINLLDEALKPLVELDKTIDLNQMREFEEDIAEILDRWQAMYDLAEELQRRDEVHEKVNS